jgi:hypothetical protein
MAEKPKRGESKPLRVDDEPGWEERFQRSLQRALNTLPQHRTKPPPKTKEQPESKGRARDGDKICPAYHRASANLRRR